MKAAQEKRRRILGHLIGNLFEPAKPLEESESGYLAGSERVSRQHVTSLRKFGYLNGLEPTEKAYLWYQDSLRGENA